MTFDLTIIDDGLPGTPEASGSEERLAKFIDELSKLTPDPEFGIYEIISKNFTTHVVTELNFPSSEPT